MPSLVSMGYDVNIIFAFVGVGAVLILGGGGSPVWGYSWLALSLMALLFTVISQLIIREQGERRSSTTWMDLARKVWGYAVATMPVSLMFLLVSWYASQYLQYQDVIKRGNLPKEYYAFDNVSTMLLVFELVALYNIVTDADAAPLPSGAPARDSASSRAKKSFLDQVRTKDSTIYYGFLIFNFIMAGFMHVILSCFITDG